MNNASSAVSQEVVIRNFTRVDRDRVRRISCDTSFLGLDRGNIFSDDEILADALTLTYTDYEPESCFVAQVKDRVVGYISGTRDVSAMSRVDNKVIPDLLLKALRRGVFIRKVNLKFFFYCFRSAVVGEFFMPDFSKKFPASLHVNIEEGYRQEGIGRKLITHYLHYLTDNHVRGVHFGTLSESAHTFFVSLGFIDLFQGKRSYLKPYLGKEINFYVLGKYI
jgi:hypothetical protein